MTAQVHFTPLRSALLAQHNNTLDVIIRVRGPQHPESHVRAPLNLSLVIDRSGSMSGAPMAEAKKCVKAIIKRLGAEDRVSVIAYDDHVDIVSPNQSCAHQSSILKAVDRIESRGMTNLFGGWEGGLKEALVAKETHELNRVILLSDGQLNQGLTDEKEIERRCAAAAELGVSTSTYGLGRSFNEHIMAIMSEAGQGNAYYGETAEDLMEPFETEFDLLSNIFARGLSLKLEAAEGVSVECMNDFKEDSGGVMIIPDLPFDAETWIGLRLTISASAIDRGQPLLALSINGLSIDGAPLQLTETLPNYPGLAPSAFEAIAPSDEVKRYFSELEVARLKIKARESARRKEWSVVEELVGVMERLDIGDWAKDGVQEIKTLMAERDVELFSKEAMISSMKSRSQHKTGLVDYTNDPLADAQERDSQERSKVSFLQRKVRQGRRRDTGS